MKMEAICILTDGTEETVWVDLDRIHSAEDLYDQVEYYFGDKLAGVSNEPDILAHAGMPPTWKD